MVIGVCTGEEPLDLDFKLLVARIEVDVFCFGLWIAYVMYKAKARKDSAEGCIVRIDLNAPIKYWSVSGVKGSPLSASSHFLTMPRSRQQCKCHGGVGSNAFVIDALH